MSLNKLVGGDCGGSNSLVQLSNIISRDVSVSNPISQADNLVREFVSQNTDLPQTFNMNTLLKTVPNVDIIKNNVEQNITQHNQVQNFIPHYSSSWRPGPSGTYVPPAMMTSIPMLPRSLHCQHNNMSNVAIEYIEESAIENTNVKAKAQEYINTVNDDEQAYNEFMSFMKKLSAGEMNFTDSSNDQRQSKDSILNEMSDKYKDEWEKLSNVTDYWSSEEANGISKEYNFTEGNVMLENKNALEIGKEKLKMGDIPGAVLCFEAAVQQIPESAEAWFLLGTTQSENEQDPLAITALKKSLKIDPRQLEAYLNLAASYTNENMPKYAYTSLLDWMKASPKYADMFPQDLNAESIELKVLESQVKSLFLKAAQMHPTDIDPDIQNALGVVFNISQEYDKAVDCFKTALTVAADDPRLWNRLGATLANSDRSEEAVDAYHHALNLEPGFIRARYNVGITCMNLGAYKEAAEHFLVALNQQHKSKRLHGDSSSIDNSSSTIWTTLRMVCSFMGEHDVAKLVDDRNLDELNNFFQMQ